MEYIVIVIFKMNKEIKIQESTQTTIVARADDIKFSLIKSKS